MLKFSDPAQILRDTSAALAPQEIITPVEAAELALVDHKTGMPWQSSKTPYMRDPLNAVASRQYRELVVMGPSRSGKTFALACGTIAYILTVAPGETAVVQMNMSEADDWAKVELEGTLTDSPKLAALRLTGVGDDTDKLKRFPGMSLRVLWPSKAKLSGKTVRTIIIIDGDNGTGDLRVEDAFALARMRTGTYLSAGMTIAEGNCAQNYDDPNWRGRTSHEAPPASGMCALYNGGTKHMRYWPCPHCSEYFLVLPGLSLFALPDLEELLTLIADGDLMTLAERFSRIICPHCGCEIEQEERTGMEARAHWVADGQTITSDGVIHGAIPRNTRTSYWAAGVMAVFNSWEGMIHRYFKALRSYLASNDDGPVRQVLNTEFCYPHIPFAIVRQSKKHAFIGRRETWEVETVPDGVRFLIATVDIQTDRFEVKVTGYGIGLESWIVDRFTIRHTFAGGKITVQPHVNLSDWKRLEGRVALHRYRCADSDLTLPIRLTCVDSGGRAGATAKAYEWWLSLDPTLRAKVRLLKGDTRVTEVVKQSIVDKNVPLLLVNTDILKDDIDGNLKITEDGPGKMHFPDWLDSKYFVELTAAEVRTAKGWRPVKASQRNEALDLTVYARAGCVFLGAHKPAFWANPPSWAKLPGENPAANPAANSQPTQSRAPARGTRSQVSMY